MPTPGLSVIEGFARKIGATAERIVKQEISDAKTVIRVDQAIAESLLTPPSAFTFDAFKDWGGQSIGRIERAGVFFATAHYSKEVIPGVLTRGSRVDFLTPADALLTSAANRAAVPRSIAELDARGFRSVVDLRLEGRGDQVPAGSTINIHRIKILDNSAPSDAQVMEFLAFIKRPENQPCYVHCEAGVGRTGIISVCAMLDLGINPSPTPHRYTAREAIAEAEKSGKMLPNQIAFIKTFAAAHGYPV